MQTVCENPFFVDNVEKLKQYPYLDKDLCCEIFIVGGGIDGENNLGRIRTIGKRKPLALFKFWSKWHHQRFLWR